MPFIADDYNGVIRRNTELFDANTMLRLGIYVYALRDPQTRRIFYVGKGGGAELDNEGNDRILSHFDEAERWLGSRHAGMLPSPKVQAILDVWKRQQAVEWFIVRHNLAKASEAFHVESALIDFALLTRNGPLTNAVAGHGRLEHGVLNEAQVAAFMAPIVSPSTPRHSVLIFQIKKALAKQADPYEAVRRSWKTNPQLRAAQPSIAVGVVDGISRVVVNISGWAPVPELPRKWEFSGEMVDDPELLNKSFASIIERAPAFLYGTYLGVHFDGAGRFKFFRGAAGDDDHQCILED